jgi:1,4-alpha-glucan branching enzyme
MTPNPLKKYKIGVPKSGKLKELFNSDAEEFGGIGISNSKLVTVKKSSWNNKKYSAEITLPPLGFIVFKQN